jgi:hypothetical protein
VLPLFLTESVYPVEMIVQRRLQRVIEKMLDET